MNAGNSITLIHGCLSDTATFSGGDWEDALPLGNLQIGKRYHRVARSKTADPADTQFDVVLSGSMPLRAVVIGPGNFTTAAGLKLTLYADDQFTQPVQSFETPPLKDRAPFGTLPFGAAYWFTGIEPWPNAERKASFIIVFDQVLGSRFWRIEITDPGNPDGYVEIGRLFMAKAFIPSINYVADDNSFGIRDNSLRSPTLSGGQVSYRRTSPRSFSFSLRYLKEEETFGPGWAFMDQVGFTEEVFVVPQPNSAFLQERSFFAEVRQANPIVQARAGYGHMGFELVEIV